MLSLTTVGVGLCLSGCMSTDSSPTTDTPTSAATPVTDSSSPSSKDDGTPSSTSSTSSPDRTPSESPTPVVDGRASPAPSCRDGYSSIDPSWVVDGEGPLGGFDLTLAKQELTPGETLVAKVRNATDEQQSTGHRKMYDIQYQTETGWHTIFGAEQVPVVYTMEAHDHDPGEGFTWRLTLTQDGLTDAVDHPPTYYVCNPLQVGTYRFVYWGITTEKEAQTNYETDYALGVPFTLSDGQS